MTTDITTEALNMTDATAMPLTTDARLALVALDPVDENAMVALVRGCFHESEWGDYAERTLRGVLRLCAAKTIRDWEATDVPLRAAMLQNA